MKMEISRATPASWRFGEKVLGFMGLSLSLSLLLIWIQAMASPVQFNQARRAGLGVSPCCLHDQGDLDVANILWRIGSCRRETRILAKREHLRSRRQRWITVILENRLRISSRKHRGIGRPECGDLGGSGVVHHIRNVRKHVPGGYRNCRGRIRARN